MSRKFIFHTILFLFYETISGSDLIMKPASASDNTEPEYMSAGDLFIISNSAEFEQRLGPDNLPIYTAAHLDDMGLRQDKSVKAFWARVNDPNRTSTLIMIVYRANDESQQYAMKCYVDPVDEFVKEVRMLKAFKWDYVATLRGYFKAILNEKLYYCYLVDRYKHTIGELTTSGIKPSGVQKLVKFAEVLSGVDYLHEHGIAHRDLIERNIMIDDHGTVKIIDFDMAHPKDERFYFGSSRNCRPPEVALRDTEKRQFVDGDVADYWGLGTLLLQLWTGEENPFQKIYQKKYSFDKAASKIRNLVKELAKKINDTQCPDAALVSKQIITLLLEPTVGSMPGSRKHNFAPVKKFLREFLEKNGHNVKMYEAESKPKLK